ncbi:Major facilitator superfamily domain, general substrate transporter [Akanthomyces lecanii RCEF 1005]|uniref:Major facilitator superfamily domain, general substrate transporter n=1 Tax=Akanthomyces lecanii RCEF 1005 TaxID=1081108 RepID=A0A168HL41_CORDF|nr:Major facilitator superfamily domain, general substrate transporter [Akanthomyces lecanii RCEF 1005]
MSESKQVDIEAAAAASPGRDSGSGNHHPSKAPLATSSVGEVLQSSGVTRMEAVYREAQTDRRTFYLVGASVLVCAWAYSLDSSTTSYYSIDASSYYKQHSTVLSTLSIATSVIGAVSKPFMAKFSDITSRPYTYLLALVFYAVGYVIAATSRSISAYIVGEVFVAVGGSGLDLTNDIIVADLTPLEWRGFVSSLLSTPFIINTWFSGKIVEAMSSRGQWRWGYGMFAIIMPVALGPAIAVLIHLDRKAKKHGLINMASSNAARRAAAETLGEKQDNSSPRGLIVAAAADAESQESWGRALLRNWHEIDAFGLILLGFGWSLLLLPFSLKTYAEHGWRNHSLIAMMVVGGVLLIAYVVYEMKWAKMPSAPRRLVFNKTFIMSIVIDSFYFFAGNMRGLYWSSYVYVAKPWSQQDWVYYGNTMTLALCIFGPITGLLQRWTHRYKAIQVSGLCLKVVGMGILLSGHRATDDTAAMVLSVVLIGAGGAMSVVGTRVASQACVPHQDVALAISLLSLWSKIGSAVGSAVVAVIWSAQMPGQLRAHLPAGTPEATVKKIFNNVKAARTLYAFDSPMRRGIIEAYRRTLFYCLTPALALAFIPLVAACFQTNFYLGKQQNAVTNVGNDGQPLKEEEQNPEPLPPAASKKEAFLRFWGGRSAVPAQRS